LQPALQPINAGPTEAPIFLAEKKCTLFVLLHKFFFCSYSILKINT
jgi:hypothetical protein